VRRPARRAAGPPRRAAGLPVPRAGEAGGEGGPAGTSAWAVSPLPQSKGSQACFGCGRRACTVCVPRLDALGGVGNGGPAA